MTALVIGDIFPDVLPVGIARPHATSPVNLAVFEFTVVRFNVFDHEKVLGLKVQMHNPLRMDLVQAEQ